MSLEERHGEEISAEGWDRIFTSVSRILAATVYLTSFSSLILSLGYTSELTPKGLLLRLVGLQISLVSVGNLLVRLPKSARQKEPLQDSDLEQLAGSLRVLMPRVVVDGPAKMVQILVRGRNLRGDNRQTLLVSRMAVVLWGRNPPAKRAHLAHELAHLKAGDSRQYARVGASLAITSLYLAASMWRAVLSQPVLLLFIVATVVLMILAWLNYTRFREFAADAIGATAARLELTSSLEAGLTSDSPSITQRLTHPSPQSRLTHLSEPSRVFTSVSSSFFLLGLASIYFSIALGLALVTFWGEHAALSMIATVVAAVILCALCMPTFLSWDALGRFAGSPAHWLRNLLFGELLALIVVADSGRVPGLIPLAILGLVVLIWISLAGIARVLIPGLFGGAGMAILWWVTSFAWAKGILLRFAMVLLRAYQRVSS